MRGIVCLLLVVAMLATLSTPGLAYGGGGPARACPERCFTNNGREPRDKCYFTLDLKGGFCSCEVRPMKVLQN